MASVLRRDNCTEQAQSARESNVDEEESTELKLAILASLSGCEDSSVLLDTLLAHDGDVQKADAVLNSNHQPLSPNERKRKASSALGYQSSLSKFTVGNQPSSKKQLTKKGKTLHLYSPEDVAAHTPCSIVHNILKPEDANTLLLELLEESNTFGTETFKVFDNVVTSPHTMCKSRDGTVLNTVS